MGLCKDGYYHEYETYDGKKHVGTGKTQKEALNKLAKKIQAAKNGDTVINNNITVKKWADTWLEAYVKDSDITHKSYMNIKGKIGKNVVSVIGSMRMRDIRDIHLQRILNEGKGMSASHVSKLNQYMRRMFKQAKKSNIIPYNPAEDLTLPKASDKKRRSLTSAERDAVLKVAETHPAGLWVKTMLYCGLRPGETFALQWKDIDLRKQTISISRALESGTTDDIKEPKSEAGVRTVPIPDHLIQDFISNQGDPFAWVFTQQMLRNKRKHLTANSATCLWKSFIEAVDIQMGAVEKSGTIIRSMLSPDLVPYVLRHTYGTDLQKAGVPINIAKYLMGHSDITTTANIYTHEDDSTVSFAADIINKRADKTTDKKENI